MARDPKIMANDELDSRAGAETWRRRAGRSSPPLSTRRPKAPPNEIVVRVFQRLEGVLEQPASRQLPRCSNEDRPKRPGIVIMIREIAKAGPAEQDAACSALIDAFGAVRPAGQDFLLQTITAIGCDMCPMLGSRRGPSSRRPATRSRHAMLSPHSCRCSKTRYGSFYLTECHWAFSTGWVDRHGGLSNSHGNRYCYFCARTIGSGTAR